MRPLLMNSGMGAATAARLGISAVLFIFIGAFSGRFATAASLSLDVYLLLALSTVVGMLIGDNAYFVASRYIGVSISLPISMSYPLLTALVAVLAMGEQGSLALWLGGILTVGGAVLLSLPQQAKPSGGAHMRRKWYWLCIGLVIAAAFAWAASTLLLKVVLERVDPITLNLVRSTFGGALITSLAVSFPRLAGAWPRRRWLWLAFLTAAGNVATLLLYVGALDTAGAARTSILAAASPLFAVPIAHYLLKEPMNRRVALGVIVTVAGVMLVV